MWMPQRTYNSVPTITKRHGACKPRPDIYEQPKLIKFAQSQPLAISALTEPKSPGIPQKEEILGRETTTPTRKLLATFHRFLESQCSTALSCIGNRCVFCGPRWPWHSHIERHPTISKPVRPLEIFTNRTRYMKWHTWGYHGIGCKLRKRCNYQSAFPRVSHLQEMQSKYTP